MKRNLQRAVLVILPLLLLAVMFASVPAVYGQGSPASENPASASPAHSDATGPSVELAKESREAAGEDEEAQFKKSASVQFVARITGLDIEKAYWLCVLLNFAVIAGGIFWLSKKNLPGLFRSRTAAIQKSMEEARQASQDANQRLAEIETRLSKLDTEIAGMRATAEKEAAAEEVRIKAATAEEARKIVESAEQEIVAAAKSARRELTAFAADLSVSLARKQIHVDAATDQGLVRNFSQQLPGDNGPKGGQ